MSDGTPAIEVEAPEAAGVRPTGDFAARWPEVAWIRHDPSTGSVRFMALARLPAADADSFVADLADFLGLDPDDLVREGESVGPDRDVVQWTRRWKGARVEGDYVRLVVIGDRAGAAWVRLSDVPAAGEPEPGEVVVAGRLARRAREGTDLVWRDRAGAVAWRYPLAADGSLFVEHEERLPGDALVLRPAEGVEVTASAVTALVDADGECPLDGPYETGLSGRFFDVTFEDAPVSALVEDGIVSDELPDALIGTWAHLDEGRAWIAARWPTHPRLTAPLATHVQTLDEGMIDAWGLCNGAYFMDPYGVAGESVWFTGPDPERCPDWGRVADIAYHELGHGIDNGMPPAPSFATDLREGSADYVAVTQTGDPLWCPEQRFTRDLDPDHVYPDDLSFDSHHTGLIWASMMWNLREAWGPERADALFLRVLQQGAWMADLYEAVLVADDDDGDLANGTPNACELAELLARHGFGPALFTVDLDPIEAPGSADAGYPVALRLDALEVCGDAGLEPKVWYTDFFDGLEHEVPLDAGADGTYTGEIPRQPASFEVRWHVELAQGAWSWRSDRGRDELAEAFWVGDRHEVWCDDLEDPEGWTSAAGTPDAGARPEDVDQWHLGEPAGGAHHVDAAFSGDGAAETASGGPYARDNRQMLASPFVDLGEPGTMRLLAYRRALTVEDGVYDHATVHAGDEGAWTPIWENPPGNGVQHLEDEGWTLHEIPLGALAGDQRFAFGLESDGNVEFGGWTIDDVCVVELDDPDGHYIPGDVSGEEVGGAVVLAWTDPWITPLGGVTVVRSANGPPETPEDGEVLLFDLAPVPGAARTWTDPAPPAEGDVWYAIFAGPTSGAWREPAVWELDRGGDPGARGGCGCQSPGKGPFSLLSLFLLAFALRRKESR